MIDELINFSTAKLAKEAGFDWECSNYYSNDGDLGRYIYYAGDGSGWDKNSTIHEHDYSLVEIMCVTPTQNLLQRWLREKHNIHITVHYYKSGKYSVCITDVCDNCMSSELFGLSFNTYEEALEEGLKQALLLIKT